MDILFTITIDYIKQLTINEGCRVESGEPLIYKTKKLPCRHDG